jgi:uncharacterized protein YodC (DUF2158 family)
MEATFKVGDVVIQRDGSVRMKVRAIDRKGGSVRCSWVRGPATHSQTFPIADLMKYGAARSTPAA